MRKDPVCGMPVDQKTPFTAECEGKMFRFCSEGCREKFLSNITCKSTRDSYDLIVIGGGPAGLTAAVYAATLRIDALLISRDLGGQAIDSTKVENYMGFDFITGPELVKKFRHQLIHSHYIDHLIAEVEAVEADEEGYRVKTPAAAYRARALLVATGMTRRKLGIPGEEDFQRRGVFYGNIPDFSQVEGWDVAVIGGGNSALQIVENLQPVAGAIHLISNSELKADQAVIERACRIPSLIRHEGFQAQVFSGDKHLSGVAIRKRGEEKMVEILVRGVFIAVGLQPNSGLAAPLLELNERGEIPIGTDCSTSRRGLFAAGDVTDAFGKRIIIAAGEGAKAAIAAREYLLHLKKRKCVTQS